MGDFSRLIFGGISDAEAIAARNKALAETQRNAYAKSARQGDLGGGKGALIAPSATPPPTPKTRVTFDRKQFFGELRRKLFKGGLDQSQVDGVTRLLDVWFKHYAVDGSAQELAYDLATSYHETGRKMQPVTESLNYSVSGLLMTFSRSRISTAEANTYGRKTGSSANQVAIANTLYGGAWGAKYLGNTEPGDGWRFRGVGDVQNTGRRNARRISDLLNKTYKLGIDLETKPEQRADPLISAHSLFIGNRHGVWTGRKISDFIDGIDESDDEDFREYVGGRYIVNGTDKAAQIAHYAVDFEHALLAAGYDVG